MKLIENYHLKKATTFKVGGFAKKLFIPENEEELAQIVGQLVSSGENLYILSGGSNLLINDMKEFEFVISMEKACLELNYIGNGVFYIGASNRIQRVIRFMNIIQYGGIEELFGLPAMFGGIIYMNAGIGAKEKSLFTISQFIKRVKVIDIKDIELKWLDCCQCEFSHRSSIFQNGRYVILGAEVAMFPQSIEISEQRISERIRYCKENQIWGKGCFGTVFSEANWRLLKMVSIIGKHINIISSGGGYTGSFKCKLVG